MTVVSKHNECKNATWQCFCIVSYHNSHREAGDVPGFFVNLFATKKGSRRAGAKARILLRLAVRELPPGNEVKDENREISPLRSR